MRMRTLPKTVQLNNPPPDLQHLDIHFHLVDEPKWDGVTVVGNSSYREKFFERRQELSGTMLANMSTEGARRKIIEQMQQKIAHQLVEDIQHDCHAEDNKVKEMKGLASIVETMKQPLNEPAFTLPNNTMPIDLVSAEIIILEQRVNEYIMAGQYGTRTYV